MKKSDKKLQKSGDTSTNIQGESIVLNQGITYSDAKEIAIDVFKSNFLELSKQASETAIKRAETLVVHFINELKSRKPEAVNSVQTPGFQYALYSAQKEYARTGEKELSDVLVDILVDRASQSERNLMQIVLDESINVIPKLTVPQMDTLTILFLLKYAQFIGINNIKGFKNYLTSHIEPFIENISSENSLYQHLEFSGCGNLDFVINKLDDIFLRTYKILFLKGFTIDELKTEFKNYSKFDKLIIKCLNNKSKYQFSALKDEDLEKQLKTKFSITNPTEIKEIVKFSNQNLMNNEEAKELLTTHCPFMEGLFKVWNKSLMGRTTLTSVGIAIGHANLRRKTGITIDLGIWIK